MPSWNIHIAHVERLLHEEEPSSLGIDDVNCFLFGNYVPDIYLGYMVPDPTTKLVYADTHFADPKKIPKPRFDEYWDLFLADGQGSDVTLGAWAHLVCDSTYNGAVREYNAAHGIPNGDRTRIRKQADFELFGKTLPITLHAEVTPELLEECEAFPQYPVLEPDVRKAVRVANAIVDGNGARPLEVDPVYDMLTQDFFLETFERVNDRLLSGLRSYGKRRAARRVGRG